MAGFIYSADTCPRNRCDVPRGAPFHPGLVEHPLVTPDVQVALLAAVDETGDIALGDLVGVLPHHPQPLSAVLALVDAGLIGLDLESPFDASCRVWRLIPAATPLG